MNGSEFTNPQPAETTTESQKEVVESKTKDLHPLTPFFDWVIRTVEESELWKFCSLLAGASVWHVGTSYAVNLAAISAEKAVVMKNVGWVLFGVNVVSIILGMDFLKYLQNKIKKWLV